MLVLVSDTHGSDSHRLTGRTLDAVEEAELVAHAGDFTTETVLDAFHEVTPTFRAVYGNSDTPAVRDRLPGERTFTYGGVRFAMTHRRRGGDTGLTMFGRERNASVVVHGHTHRPRFNQSGPVALLNPGSHAEPRGHRAAHAELESTDSGLAGRLVTVDGETLEEFTIG